MTITMWRVSTALALVADLDCTGTVAGYVRVRTSELDEYQVVVSLNEPATATSARPSGDRSGPLQFALVAVALDAVTRLDERSAS